MLVTQQKVLRKFWYALMPMSALDAGPQPFTLLGENIVVWKGKDGKPAALRDRCCHRTAKLSKGFVENGNIVCGYHGWTYDCSGTCVRIPQSPDTGIPAGARVTAYHCDERYGYVWVALEDPLQPIPYFPEEGAPGYRRILQFYEEWKTSPLRVMENSFDNSHFSFVHKANFGMIDNPVPAKYEFRPNDWGFEAETHVPVRNPEASFRITGTTEPVTERHLTNRWYMPFSRRFGCVYPASSIHHIIYNCATPIDDGRLMLVQWLYRNDSEEACSTQELIDWDRPITSEDRDILEATDPDACVDTRRRVEFHMESDKPGLMMRRMLMDLLSRHGESEVHNPPEA
ncbi:aromatic ring-hydroxylating dioxygenase subunit alpha [Pseudoduganella albidiflava]|uniref:(2Fe-2S)-binding protein n=1 Tax=Pseudoduganella albidiflava TaxID=321983 RepID=A0A411WVJ5_9BURK|nr:aromatic ring-hydroxylating dioxygenase subunit alpha [Pseudoduganella albidiflava]QBI00648.1 aromatic ring-hydroxylating dioxygenase subunit alpha [Pseudoduganella albidiflava]GGY31706.1 (2Fe-2S)-binding protein [Pseudoduganella albidiflava]